METARIRESTSIDDTFDISERGGDTSERGGGDMDIFDISDRSSNNTNSPASSRKKNRRSRISLKRKRKVKNNTIEPTRAAYDKIEIIESFLRDEIEMSNEMTKSGFRQLLLDHAGIHIDDTLLDAIFVQTDEDGTGGLPPPPFGGDEQQAPPSVSTASDRARMAAQMNVGRMNQGLMNWKTDQDIAL